MAERIQRKRTKGWRLPEGAIYVGRGSRWGNPFTIAAATDAEYENPRRACVSFYRAWLDSDPSDGGFSDVYELGPIVYDRVWVRDNLAQLRGHDLACWCPIVDADGNRVPCHADLLIELAAQARQQ